MSKTLNKETRRRIVELYSDGHKIVYIAAKLKLRVADIQQVILDTQKQSDQVDEAIRHEG
jgi:hypothetical protein